MNTQDAKQPNLDAFEDLILDSPALAPPPGVESNLIDPPSRPDLSLGFLIPCLVILVAMTLMRLYVKLFIVKKMHTEDYFLLVALASQWNMSVRNIKKFLLDFHVGAIFYDVTILTLKLAILLQFLRIFIPKGDRSVTFWITHIVLWTNTVFYIIMIFIEIFACDPIAKLWDPLITEGKCLNTPLEYLICASFNCALDAAILIWTQKVIWSLHMSTARKLKLGVLFLAGLIACIFGGLSVWMNVRLLRTEDQTYTAGIMALFTFPETTSGFLVLCLPVFPKFFNTIKAKICPETPTAFKKIRQKLFHDKETLPHAYPARQHENQNKRQQRSWWHISTNKPISESNIESVEVKAGLSNIDSREYREDPAEV